MTGPPKRQLQIQPRSQPQNCTCCAVHCLPTSHLLPPLHLRSTSRRSGCPRGSTACTPRRWRPSTTRCRICGRAVSHRAGQRRGAGWDGLGFGGQGGPPHAVAYSAGALCCCMQFCRARRASLCVCTRPATSCVQVRARPSRSSSPARPRRPARRARCPTRPRSPSAKWQVGIALEKARGTTRPRHFN